MGVTAYPQNPQATITTATGDQLPTWMLERPWRTSGNDTLDALMRFRTFHGTHAQCPGCGRVVDAADFPAHAGYIGLRTAAPCAALAEMVAAYRAHVVESPFVVGIDGARLKDTRADRDAAGAEPGNAVDR